MTDETQNRASRAAAPPWGPKPARGPIREVISGCRFYNPDLGRWINRDPVGCLGGMNLYAFVVNSPVYVVDDLGTNPIYSGGGSNLDEQVWINLHCRPLIDEAYSTFKSLLSEFIADMLEDDDILCNYDSKQGDTEAGWHPICLYRKTWRVLVYRWK